MKFEKMFHPLAVIHSLVWAELLLLGINPRTILLDMYGPNRKSQKLLIGWLDLGSVLGGLNG